MNIAQQIKQGLIANKTVIDNHIFTLAHGRTYREIMSLTGLSLRRISQGLTDHIQMHHNLKGKN